MTDSWDNFFLGELGASAALGGLLFVSISISLSRILAVPDLPIRAALAILLLLAVLIVSSLMLMPRQTNVVAGMASLVPGAILVVVGTAIEAAIGRSPRERNPITFAVNVVLFAAAAVPYLVGGVMLVTGAAAGFYWIAAAMIFSIIKAVVDAWVLLVEINR